MTMKQVWPVQEGLCFRATCPVVQFAFRERTQASWRTVLSLSTAPYEESMRATPYLSQRLFYVLLLIKPHSEPF